MMEIEPAMSAWEAERSGLLCGLTCLDEVPGGDRGETAGYRV